MLIYMNTMIIVALSFLELKANKITMYCDVYLLLTRMKLVFLTKNHNVL
jgi:hypothetical protein